jgi:hypothetical protein
MPTHIGELWESQGVRGVRTNTSRAAEKALSEAPPLPQETATHVSEAQKKSFTAFIADTFNRWDSSGAPPKSTDVSVRSPQDILDDHTNGYDFYKTDTVPSRSGELIVNPDTLSVNYEEAIKNNKVTVVDLATDREFRALKDKSLTSIATFVVAYAKKHNYRIPGAEFWQWAIENPQSIPKNHDLKDGKYHFCFGSLLRDRRGRWHVPYFRWRGSGFRRSARWLDGGWGGSCRVVLLEN